jgi:hypothetical protein
MDNHLSDEIDEELISQVTAQHGVMGKMVTLMYRRVTNHIPHRLSQIETTQRFHGLLLFAILAFVLSASAMVLVGVLLGLGR